MGVPSFFASFADDTNLGAGPKEEIAAF